MQYYSTVRASCSPPTSFLRFVGVQRATSFDDDDVFCRSCFNPIVRAAAGGVSGYICFSSAVRVFFVVLIDSSLFWKTGLYRSTWPAVRDRQGPSRGLFEEFLCCRCTDDRVLVSPVIFTAAESAPSLYI